MSAENEKETDGLQILDEEMDIEEQQEKTTFDIAELGQALKVASEGAITAKTVQTYQRYLTATLYSEALGTLLTVGKYVKGFFQICRQPR
jgi:hypothetical protein